MKKIALILALTGASMLHAQLIDRNDIILHAGIGAGIYHYQLTDLQTNIANPRDTSGSVQYLFQAEYGVNRWLSGGLTYNFQHFLTDSSGQSHGERAIVMDFGLSANFHIPWNLEKFDFSASLGYAYSRFRYTVDDLNNWEAVANGTVFFWGVNPRLYFSKNQHLGMEFWYRHTSHLYKKGEITDNNGFLYNFKLDGPGNSFGLGLFYKI